MKKAKLLIVTLVCAVMLMGVGYAWWTDSVTIGGTAATGNMNVIFVNGQKPNFPTIFYPMYSVSNYAEAEVTATEKLITCTFSNLYPNAVARVDFIIKNNGTIPVKLNKATITVTVDGDETLRSYLVTTACFYKCFADGSIDYSTNSYIEKVPLNELEGALNNSLLKDIVLEPGETLYFGVPEGEEAYYDLDGDGEKESCIVLYVDKDAPNDTQNNTVTVNLTMDWKQFNQQ